MAPRRDDVSALVTRRAMTYGFPDARAFVTCTAKIDTGTGVFSSSRRSPASKHHDRYGTAFHNSSPNEAKEKNRTYDFIDKVVYLRV